MKPMFVAALLITCLTWLPAIGIAQEGPRPDGANGPNGPNPPGMPGGPGGPGGPNQPGMQSGPGMPGGGPGMQPGPGGPGGPGGGPGGPQRQQMPGPRRPSPEMAQLDRMRGYIEVVDRFSRLARDPAASGVAAVIAASDMLKPRGTDAAIEFFTKTLPQVKNDAVQRAIRLQLIDLYKASGQQDKALEQMSQLMTSAPAGAAGSQPGPGDGGPPPPPR